MPFCATDSHLQPPGDANPLGLGKGARSGRNDADLAARARRVWDGVKTEVDLSRLNELADRIREGTEAAVRLTGMLAGSPRWYGRNLELGPI